MKNTCRRRFMVEREKDERAYSAPQRNRLMDWTPDRRAEGGGGGVAGVTTGVATTLLFSADRIAGPSLAFLCFLGLPRLLFGFEYTPTVSLPTRFIPEFLFFVNERPSLV